MLLFRVFSVDPLDLRALLPDGPGGSLAVEETRLDGPPGYPPGTRAGTDPALDRYVASRYAYDIAHADADSPEARDPSCATAQPRASARGGPIAALRVHSPLRSASRGTPEADDPFTLSVNSTSAAAVVLSAAALAARLARSADDGLVLDSSAGVLLTAGETEAIGRALEDFDADAAALALAREQRAEAQMLIARLRPRLAGPPATPGVEPPTLALGPREILIARVALEDSDRVELRWVSVDRWQGETMSAEVRPGQRVEWPAEAVLELHILRNGVPLTTYEIDEVGRAGACAAEPHA